MQSSSRRAFLTGRRTEQSPWEAFLSQLRRHAPGCVQDFSTPVPSARLVPTRMEEVYRARALCLTHEVCFALDGVPAASRLDESPVLWVEPGVAMARCERLGAEDPRWFVQPGCLVGDLEQAGLPQFRDQPPHLTVAAWLADRQLCDWDAGHTADSGLVHALVLLADGTQANLGAFGVDNRKPLDNVRVRTLVSRLFELGATTEALRDGVYWNGHYRLDALMPAPDRGINLAHLLLGHGGELGWVEWLVFDERIGQPVERLYAERYGQRDGFEPAPSELDLEIRNLFDPEGVFPIRGQRY